MFPIESFRDTVLRFIQLLNDFQIPFHFTGGAAAVTHGDPRMTQDVDVVVSQEACLRQVENLIAAFKLHNFLMTDQVVREAIRDGRSFQILDNIHILKIDVFPRELVPGELSRSVTAELMTGIAVPIASRMDAVISKLIWISKGSGKSRHDLKQMLLRATPEEVQTVHAAAEERGLKTLLEEVLAEPDEIDL